MGLGALNGKMALRSDPIGFPPLGFHANVRLAPDHDSREYHWHTMRRNNEQRKIMDYHGLMSTAEGLLPNNSEVEEPNLSRPLLHGIFGPTFALDRTALQRTRQTRQTSQTVTCWLSSHIAIDKDII